MKGGKMPTKTKRVMINIPIPLYEVLEESRDTLTNKKMSQSRFILELALIGLNHYISEMKGEEQNENN